MMNTSAKGQSQSHTILGWYLILIHVLFTNRISNLRQTVNIDDFIFICAFVSYPELFVCTGHP